MSPLDRTRLLEALALAEGSIGLTDPNPRVGCILGHEDGRVLGRGATQRAGEAHAEVMALRDAAAAGHDLRGATAWVTLEPCAHHGRTPPCCEALAAAGIARVVVAVGDPFPQVAGAGIARLRAAGVQVELADADIAAAARELNIGFFSRVERGRPWVRMKIAASLDGRTALANGASQWITGAEARTDGHAWRRRAGCVLTGIGTVLDDDPRLDVRLVATALQPMRAVVDSRLRTPPTARLLAPPGRCIVFAAVDDGAGAALRAAGAELRLRPGADGRVALDAVLADLAALGVNELHVEAGARLNAAWLASGRVDELLVYTAPLLLGEGRAMAALGPFDTLAQGLRFAFVGCQPVGADLRLLARPLAIPAAP
ncbi:bifunctional diaminohydroxyphosphoribosylaminopyrimidine deaminase/5-amino-6-(5-phosphoribosylamino)uracil reductase RibD [Rubrivivax gelatinosus]|uniref:Riboflavin biosynthesis protein RibD n=1 Tax=Rubrivivax gelatinosus TaxID=28068 RepID=A0ABS1DVM9_RUBGE|nr:bifunctional diaminohydroxyphosphoribosylaminopyrimidine deaminase/5-amino-6-(5-phosphoribosylamino)uracil reductase RibD [Rubrivivax gelatinosus]MBK1713714.1 riboflavin biosynthesis protein RibD [Rubrivivax gelatinosus]